jgi:RNA polymerase sigma-70 factor (ECF subfamily)
VGIPETTDTAAVSAAAERSETVFVFACNSEITSPAVDRYCGIQGNDRGLSTLPKGIAFEDMLSTMTAANSNSGPSAWDCKLATFVQVAEQRRAQMLWLAQRITSNREEAEDIVQEALLRAFKKLPHFRGESQMGTWLGVIVQNTGREWLRRQKGRVYLPLESVRNSDDEPVVLDFPDPGRNPEQCCEHSEMENILLSEIDELNSVCKRAIQMCALEELSHLEAANALGVNVFTIKSRIFNGKRMLKRAVSLYSREVLSDGLSSAHPRVQRPACPEPNALARSQWLVHENQVHTHADPSASQHQSKRYGISRHPSWYPGTRFQLVNQLKVS